MTRTARDIYGLKNIQTKLFQTEMFPQHSFDFVILSHTLEHLERPETILNDISDVLKPGGLLYIEVPDIYHPKSSFYTSFFAMPHLYVFSVRTLERLLAQHGFQVIAAGNVPRGICVLAKPGETIALEHRDDPEAIHSLIDSYKRRHDRDTFLYRYIANSIPAKILIKSRLPWISRALAQFRERVRVNKII